VVKDIPRRDEVKPAQDWVLLHICAAGAKPREPEFDTRPQVPGIRVMSLREVA